MAAQLQKLSQMEIYLDPTTLLPLSLAFNVHPDGDANTNIPIEIRYSNYQAVNGVQVPFHIQRFINGTLFLDLTVQSVTINSGISASAFTLP